ncbi:CopG family transcriptional regulator [Frondihabitans sp. PAMC 28766]|uniref:CopG family transcriptional regulator n=1 Tax=Frondihabitans sp. PAMC 28766 TaxID=1795630 RepID=UPI00078BC503|nr:CopG family transcriptional regulator [Frondihabitans sp. PAMC 28766]AMM21520.1 CopG family transcriptional regulator [Frondihabitans sp. PAMC 28766]
MRTAISLPDGDFERFERVAARNHMNRSEFYRLAADKLARELEGDAELTAQANAAIARAGQPSEDSAFLRASEQNLLRSTEW